MGTTRVPTRYQHICDCCGAMVESPADSRPALWTMLIWKRDVLDFQGAAVSDGAVPRLLCAACSTAAADAIGAALAQRDNVIADVAAECRRQVEEEGFTPEHDANHAPGELAEAAACYALKTTRIGEVNIWPWDWSWWKPKGRRRDLVRAAALIVAEIKRLDRVASAAAKGETT